MRVYYRMPEYDSDEVTKILALAYENMCLKIQLQLAPIQVLTKKSKGILFIENIDNEIKFRYEGFTPELELIIKAQLSGLVKKPKTKR